MTSPVATAASASRISAAFSSAVRCGVVTRRSRRAPPGSTRVGTTCTGLVASSRRLLGAEDTFELFGSRIDLGRVERARSPRRAPPSRGSWSARPRRRGVAPSVSKSRRFPSPGDDRDDAGLHGRQLGTASSSRCSRCSVCCVHVRDLDSLDRAAARAERERRAGVVGVDVHLDRASRRRRRAASRRAARARASSASRSSPSPSTTKTVQ